MEALSHRHDTNIAGHLNQRVRALLRTAIGKKMGPTPEPSELSGIVIPKFVVQPR
jgi:hypothetical protein